jgi:uncharacterized protein (TIGR00725 family)
MTFARSMSERRRIVAVCGASRATDDDRRAATAVGTLLAERGFLITCGGGQGVAAAAAAAVSESGGTCIGLLPGGEPDDVAPGISIPIATGLGHLRNALIVRSSDAVIAIGGGYGTLSEIAFALVLGKPVVAMNSWRVVGPDQIEPDPGVHRAASAAEAVAWIEARLR